MDKQQIIHKLLCNLQLRGYSKGTEIDYSKRIKHFQEYFNKSASELGEQEIREYLHYLKNNKNLSTSTVCRTYPFIAPAVRPEIILSCKSIYTITLGTTVITTAASSRSYLVA